MKITILTYGSRGDVQPFLALALGLQKAGHTPTLAAPQSFAEFVGQHKIPFAPLPGDPQEISVRFNDAGRNPVRTIRAISDYVFKIAPEVSHAAVAACEQADLIIHGFLFTAGGHTIACQRGIPDLSIQTFPMFAPTRAFPNVSMAQIPPGILSYASHWLFDRVFRYGGNSGYGRIRRAHPDLPLPASLSWPFAPIPPRPRTPLLFAFSQSVIPSPHEWQGLPYINTPGYFFMDDRAYQPPQALVDFLDAGEAPICITFGSMVNRQMERIRSIMRDALLSAHQRAILLAGWGGWGLSSAPEADILTLDSAPHDWLFPQCKFIIHHGGAGTTAAALRAGVPSMVIPLAGDQPFWAQRVDALGVGPRSISLRSLSAQRLVDFLAEAELQVYRARAQAVGRTLRSEDGVGVAIRLIEQYMDGFQSKRAGHQP